MSQVGGFFESRHIQHVKPMFEMSCWPMLAAFSQLLESAEDPKAIHLCLDGLRYAIRISGKPSNTLHGTPQRPGITRFVFLLLSFFFFCFFCSFCRRSSTEYNSGIFYMETERNAFVSSLVKFTKLNHTGQMGPKNIESIKTVIRIANSDGNYLQVHRPRKTLCYVCVCRRVLWV